MFRIGEFSQLVRVSPRMLRHYEKCGLLAPAEIDPFTGYRQYSASQIPAVSRIAALRDMGFTIGEIGEILPRFEDGEYLRVTLRRKAAEVRESMAAAEARLKKLMEMSGELRKESDIMLYEVELKKLDAVKVLSLRGLSRNIIRKACFGRNLAGILAKTRLPATMTDTPFTTTANTWRAAQTSKLQSRWTNWARAGGVRLQNLSCCGARGNTAFFRPV